MFMRMRSWVLGAGMVGLMLLSGAPVRGTVPPAGSAVGSARRRPTGRRGRSFGQIIVKLKPGAERARRGTPGRSMRHRENVSGGLSISAGEEISGVPSGPGPRPERRAGIVAGEHLQGHPQIRPPTFSGGARARSGSRRQYAQPNFIVGPPPT